MSMTADGLNARRTLSARFRVLPPRRGCAHPMVFAPLAGAALLPLALAIQRQGLPYALLPPAAMATGGWLGAARSDRGAAESSAMLRMLGVICGAAVSTALGHCAQSVLQCRASTSLCAMEGAIHVLSGMCAVFAGGVLGAGAWSGFNRPFVDGNPALLAALVGAYALGGWSTPLAARLPPLSGLTSPD